jgi:hypothetical protein
LVLDLIINLPLLFPLRGVFLPCPQK